MEWRERGKGRGEEGTKERRDVGTEELRDGEAEGGGEGMGGRRDEGVDGQMEWLVDDVSTCVFFPGFGSGPVVLGRFPTGGLGFVGGSG